MIENDTGGELCEMAVLCIIRIILYYVLYYFMYCSTLDVVPLTLAGLYLYGRLERKVARWARRIYSSGARRRASRMSLMECLGHLAVSG